MKAVWFIVFLFFLHPGGIVLTANSQKPNPGGPSPDYEKAVFIRFLAASLNWHSTSQYDPLTLCIWGADGLTSELNRMGPIEKGGKYLQLRVLPIQSTRELVPCQLLIVAGNETERKVRLIQPLIEPACLLMAENIADSCKASISFFYADNKIRYTICKDKLIRTGITDTFALFSGSILPATWRATFEKYFPTGVTLLTPGIPITSIVSTYEMLLAAKDRKQQEIKTLTDLMGTHLLALRAGDENSTMPLEKVNQLRTLLEQELRQLSGLREEMRGMEDRLSSQKKLLLNQGNKLSWQNKALLLQGESLGNKTRLISNQQTTIGIILFLSVGVLLLSVLLIWFNQQRKETNRLLASQKALVEEQKLNITDSINYARGIQSAILPPLSDILTVFPHSFILYKPKDIVSGDFYWYAVKNSRVFFAAADCTGHGVPGGFMSMIATELLHEAIQLHDNLSDLLQEVNVHLKKTLRQSQGTRSPLDGMDIALIAYSPDQLLLEYAGAYRPLWILRSGSPEIQEIKGTKAALGGYTPIDQRFVTHRIQLSPGDRIYLFSDGYVDQFGRGHKKLMTGKFRQLLLTLRDYPMKEQYRYLDEFMENWKGGLEQTDDILVVGVEV